VGASHLFLAIVASPNILTSPRSSRRFVRCNLETHMSRPLQKHSHPFRSKPPLLLTESQSEFDDLEASFRNEILPRGRIEQIYFDDIIASVWEILRLRRCKTVIVNIAFKRALHALLDAQLGYDYDRANDLVERWFNDPAARSEVVGVLGE